MNMRLHAFTVLLLLGLPVPAPWARTDVRPFPYLKNLERMPDANTEVGLFLLDNEIHAATDSRYANLRLMDADGAEVPFYLRRKIHTATQYVETVITSRISDFEKLEGNQARIFVDIEKSTDHADVLVLHTRDRNYEKLVSVYGSRGRDRWEPLARDVRIYDYSRHIDVRNNRIELPPNTFRQLRIDLSNFVELTRHEEFEVTTESRGQIPFSNIERRKMREESIRVEGIELRARTTAIRPDEPFRVTCSNFELTMTANDRDQANTWIFSTDRQPLASLSLATRSRNFSRRALVQGKHSGDKSPWEWLGETTLFSLDFETVQEHQLTIPLARESRYEQYRITVYNQDNPPLELFDVIATGLVYEVLFMADPETSYSVYYGGKDISSPRYDIETILKRVPSLKTVSYALNEETTNPLFKEGYRPGGLKTKLFFGTAMAAMIILLAWLIAKGAGKVEQL